MNFLRTILSPLCKMTLLPLFLLLLIAGASHAQESLPDVVLKRIAADLEQYVEKSRHAWGVPAIAIGIVAGDDLVYARGFGVRSLGSKDPVDPDTVFQIGSTTKAFLATTEAMLFDQGKLDGQDRVLDHAPDFRLYDPWVTRELRIADLLCQRSGLPGWTATNLLIYEYSQDQVLEALRYVKPVTSFRSAFAYQNAFHLLAGKIQAKIFEVATWEEALQRELFDPLKMTSSSYTSEGLLATGNFAKGHHLGAEQVQVQPTSLFPYNSAGAGAINSTVRDMSRWLRFQINGGELEGRRLISKDRLQETHHPRIILDEHLRQLVALDSEDVVSYASGWLVHSLPYGRVIEHAGGTIGYNSYVAFDPDRKLGVIVLTNAIASGDRGLAIPLGKYILDRLHERPKVDYAARALEDAAQEAAPVQHAPSRPLDQYVGNYSSPILGAVSVRTDKHGSLSFLLGPSQLPVVLRHVSGDLFMATVINPSARGDEHGLLGDPVLVHFQADSSDKIEKLEWGLQGSSEFTEFLKL